MKPSRPSESRVSRLAYNRPVAGAPQHRGTCQYKTRTTPRDALDHEVAQHARRRDQCTGGAQRRGVLADQPLVSSTVIQFLVENYEASRKEGIRIVRPKYQADLGHPILIDAELFNEFYTIEGDSGGKSIIKKYKHVMKIVSFDNPMWGVDVDTPEDFMKMKQYFDSEHNEE
jgi:CTP:molybdopterin cytidylyltransferase MocA